MLTTYTQNRTYRNQNPSPTYTSTHISTACRYTRHAILHQPRPCPGRQRNLPPCPEPTPSLLPLPRYIPTSAYRPTPPMRSSPTVVIHSSPRIRRSGESQFLPALRTGGTMCLHCQSPAANPPRLLYPLAGEYTSGSPSCSTAPVQSPDPAVPSLGCGHLSSMPLHHPPSPGAGVIPYILPLLSGLHAHSRLCQHGPSLIRTACSGPS